MRLMGALDGAGADSGPAGRVVAEQVEQVLKPLVGGP
jgi:hypothetical protein